MFRFSVFVLLFLFIHKPSPSLAAHMQEGRNIIIKAISGLQYDQVRLVVKPGETVSITLMNTDEMAHNMLITQPGQREAVVALAAAMEEQGPAKGYVPETDKVLAAIPVLKPGEQQSMVFKAPEQEGVFPYVCTYPGHGLVMYGALYVTNSPLPPLATDLNVPPRRREAEDTNEAKESGHPWPSILPTMYRTFMPESGPASIAVGMMGNVSYCWDATQCRLRYAGKVVFWTLPATGRAKERSGPM